MLNKRNQQLVEDSRDARATRWSLWPRIRERHGVPDGRQHDEPARCCAPARRTSPSRSSTRRSRLSTGNDYAFGPVRYCSPRRPAALCASVKADVVTPPRASAPTPAAGRPTRRRSRTSSTARGRCSRTTATTLTRDTTSIGIQPVHRHARRTRRRAETMPEQRRLPAQRRTARPTASFTAITSRRSSHVQLNGSDSVDPEGELLDVHSGRTARPCSRRPARSSTTSPRSSGSHMFTLTVTDPGGLTHTATQQVTVLP